MKEAYKDAVIVVVIFGTEDIITGSNDLPVVPDDED